MNKKKIPVSTLIIIHDSKLNILLLERADRPNFWQSVTGSLNFKTENLTCAAQRELKEETGLNLYDFPWLNWNFSRKFKIFDHWVHRYEKGVKENTEFIFSVCIAKNEKIKLSPREHLRYEWFSSNNAIKKCFSWTNKVAIEELPNRFKEGY